MTTDLVDRIIAYEQGDMDQEEMVEFFQELVDDGLAFRLQGHYGRTAARLIEAGLVRQRQGTK
jgi:hypothetical protein